jgi:recombination protein RecT
MGNSWLHIFNIINEFGGVDMTNLAIQEPVNNKQVIEQVKNQFLSVSIDKRVAWEKEFNFAMQLLQANKYLDDVAWSNTDSLRNAIINVSAIGISLNPALKHAYLVPRDKKVCLDVSYMGLLHLACASGSIVWGQAKIVRENDNYRSMGIDKAPEHQYNPFVDRGAIVGTYCTVKTAQGDYLTEEMSLNAVYDIRDRSMAFKKNSGPWVTDPEQMIRKTVVKRASSYWPKVERLDSAIQMLNIDNEEGINFEDEKPKGKSGNWRPGNNPDSLPPKLREVFFNMYEAFEMEDYQVVSETLSAFAVNEEKQAVWRCFASDERTALNKFAQSEEYTQVVNQQKVEHLSGEELEQFLKRFNN